MTIRCIHCKGADILISKCEDETEVEYWCENCDATEIEDIHENWAYCEGCNDYFLDDERCNCEEG